MSSALYTPLFFECLYKRYGEGFGELTEGIDKIDKGNVLCYLKRQREILTL